MVVFVGCWITERQWLSFVCSRRDWAWHDACARCDFAALAVAINAPDAVATRSDAPPFAARLAAQLSALLIHPPIAHHPRGLAFGTVDLICALNGLVFTLDERSRTRLAVAIEAERVTDDALERTIESHLVRLPDDKAQEAREQALAQIGPPGIARPVIVISIPWTRVGAGTDVESEEESRLREMRLVESLRRATRRVAGELFGSYISLEAIKAEQAGLGNDLIQLEIPVVEFGWHKNARDVTASIGPRLWQACAHLTLGLDGGSHGTGLEAGQVREETVTFYIHIDDGWEPSALARGNLAATRATVDTVPDDDAAIVEKYLQWLTDNVDGIRAAWRAAELRLIRYSALASAFAVRLENLAPEGRTAFARMAGIDEDAVPLLQNPHGLQRLGLDSVERAAIVLCFDAREFLHPASPGPLSAAQADALLDYMEVAKLTSQVTKRLRKEAERQQLAGVLRFGLIELREWAAFREELRERYGLDV